MGIMVTICFIILIAIGAIKYFEHKHYIENKKLVHRIDFLVSQNHELKLEREKLEKERDFYKACCKKTGADEKPLM